jgi:hypothetical protein
MNSHADKTQENKSKSVSHEGSEKQTGGEATFQLQDNRPEALAQRKQQEMANNSPQVKQLKALQDLANNSPQAKQAAQLQAKADHYASQQMSPIHNNSNNAAGSTNNTGLPDNLKSGVENLSGESLDDVKVHYNSDKPAQLQAHAYAQGTDVHVATGQEKHLPHEAWHVVQQKQGRVQPTLQMKEKVNVNDDVSLEKEADEMGEKAMRTNGPGFDSPSESGKSNGAVQRKVIQLNGEEGEPAAKPGPAEAVRILWDAPKGAHKSLVYAAMEKTPGFILELSKEDRGRKLLESMVNGSVASYIPNVGMLMNLFAPVGTQSTFIQGPIGLIAGLFGIGVAALSGIQSLVSWVWSGLISNHKKWIIKLMMEEFELNEITDSWSEEELRKTYMAFHMLPKGTVRAAVTKLARTSGIGSFASGSEIHMGTLLPASITMGGAEPLTRLIGKKFLKGSSEHSKKMKYKNAWTMTVLHEVGHTVDTKRNIMATHKAKPAFGGWQDHTNENLAEAILGVYTGTPVENFTVAEAQVLGANQQETEAQRDIFNSSRDKEDPTYKDDKDYFNKVKDPAKKRIAELSEQKETIKKDERKRTWLTEQRVTRAMLKDAITAAGKKEKPMDKVSASTDYKEMSAPAKEQAKGIIENHPAVLMAKNNFGMDAWDRQDSEMATIARPFNGRYFHRSYPGPGNKVDGSQWTSFLVASRKDAVSHYQYRAPGEWFAEVYAHYYLGTLEGHPLYDWFKRTVDVELNPEAVLGAPVEPTQQEMAAAGAH